MELNCRHFNTQIQNDEMERRLATDLSQWKESIVNQYVLKKTKALSIGCGADREAIALAKRRDGVTGIDIAEKELASARRIVTERGLDIDFGLVDSTCRLVTVAKSLSWRV
jgi:2-polyprenyl-3-methyl-5-hydroxy-6-metoxy-1,4-benzoquinol methylase